MRFLQFTYRIALVNKNGIHPSPDFDVDFPSKTEAWNHLIHVLNEFIRDDDEEKGQHSYAEWQPDAHYTIIKVAKYDEQ